MYRRAPRTGRSRYSARTATTSTKTGRANAVARARATNKPVARIQRKRAAPITRVAKNTASVAVLARQVRSLQRAQIGLIQRHVLDASTQFWIPQVTPAIFSLINFENNSNIIECRQSDTAPYLTTVTLASLTPRSDQQMAVAPGNTAKAAVLDPYKFYKTATDDAVPLDGSYVPISTNLLISLSTNFSASTNESDRWVLIMFIKQKTASIKKTTNVHHYNLPDAAAGLTHLASSDSFERLPFPHQYYTVLEKKWIKLVNPPQATNRTVERTVNMKFNYPHQYVNNDHSMATNPTNVSGTIQDDFNARIPIGQNIFCIMQVSGGGVNCKLRKTDVWRDPHGND